MAICPAAVESFLKMKTKKNQKQWIFTARADLEGGKAQDFNVFKKGNSYWLDDQIMIPSDKCIAGIIREIEILHNEELKITSIKYPHLEEFIPYSKKA